MEGWFYSTRHYALGKCSSPHQAKQPEVCHGRPPQRERAGLVKHDGADAMRTFQRVGALTRASMWSARAFRMQELIGKQDAGGARLCMEMPSTGRAATSNTDPNNERPQKSLY